MSSHETGFLLLLFTKFMFRISEHLESILIITELMMAYIKYVGSKCRRACSHSLVAQNRFIIIKKNNKVKL